RVYQPVHEEIVRTRNELVVKRSFRNATFAREPGSGLRITAAVISDARRSAKLANQVQRPNLVRLTQATLASTRCASPAVSRARFASFEPGQRISRPLPGSRVSRQAHSGIRTAASARAVTRKCTSRRRLE